MSNSSDFSKKFEEAKRIGDVYGKQGGGAGFITEIKIEFGFWAYGGQEHDRMKFWKQCDNFDEAEVIRAEVQARLDKAGVSEEADYCLRVYASGSSILNRDTMDWNRNEFYGRWQWDDKDGGDTCVSLITDSVEENNLPVGQKFWGRYQLKANPYHVRLGEKGKKEGKDGKMYWPTFTLPVEYFANESVARAAAAGGSVSGGNSDNNSQWSDKARAEYDPISELTGLQKEISEWYAKMIGGTPFNNDADNFPFPKPLTPPNVKKQLAEIYTIETADIDILLSMDIAF